MFNLESSIANWRRQMFAAGITHTSLDELELHLREEIARQMRSGLNNRQSFHAAVGIIGRAGPLGTEFNKVDGYPGSRFVKLFGLACGVVAGLFTAWILFVLLTIHESNWPERLSGLLAVAAIILAWYQGGRWLPALRLSWLRPLTGVLCCLASLGGMELFITAIAPHYLAQAAGASLPVGPMLIAFVWTWAAAAMLGILAYKLQGPVAQN
jgi:hypothetical protein